VAATLALFPMLRLLLRLVDRPLRPALYLLSAFFVLDRLRGFAAIEPRLEENLVLVEFVAAIVLLAWLVRSRLRPAAVPNGGLSARIAYAGGRTLLVLFGLSFLAGAFGYMRLARLVGTGFLRSTYFALVMFAAYRVALGLLAYVLQTRVLGALGMVRRHRPLIERRLGAALRVAAFVFWLLYLLHTTVLWEPTKEAVEAIVTATLHVGEVSVSLGDLIAFGLAVWISFLLSAFVRFALEEDVYPRLRLARGVPYAVSTLLHYSILLVGFFLAFAAMGLDLNRFTILAGAFGVGIGFGLQNIVNNFVSGLILLFERPVQVGDTVQLGEIFGEVLRIGIRSSTVRTPEGAEVIVPNASLIADPLTNWTLSDRMRRVDVPVGVAYGSNPEQVQEILRYVAAQHPLVRRDPPPVVLFKALGESSLDFELRAWTNSFENWAAIRSELVLAIHEALGQAGIAIPFPQRDVHVRTLGPLGPLAGRSE
jgi:small-conductance mechanosensitive channel